VEGWGQTTGRWRRSPSECPHWLFFLPPRKRRGNSTLMLPRQPPFRFPPVLPFLLFTLGLQYSGATPQSLYVFLHPAGKQSSIVRRPRLSPWPPYQLTYPRRTVPERHPTILFRCRREFKEWRTEFLSSVNNENKALSLYKQRLLLLPNLTSHLQLIKTKLKGSTFYLRVWPTHPTFRSTEAQQETTKYKTFARLEVFIAIKIHVTVF
jgi:hypothetical protein